MFNKFNISTINNDKKYKKKTQKIRTLLSLNLFHVHKHNLKTERPVLSKNL